MKSALEATCHLALEALLSRQRYSEAAVLAARTRTFGCGTVACWDLPSEPATVPQTRKLVADKLDSWNMKGVIPTRSSSSANWSPTPSVTPAPRSRRD
ncbi:hypothetical protein E4K10_43660 [Streptomyces sp. T1317-0309]|nr:hypothetical protein E4K10_43660 [Streptomyces sp. T1317-0309]